MRSLLRYRSGLRHYGPLLLVLLCSCSGEVFQGYALSKPDQRIALPGDLREVSDLAWSGPEQLSMVQDERGILFLYDLSKRAVDTKVKFEKRGDFEGVARDGDRTFMVESNGRVHLLDAFGDPDGEQHWDTFLDTDNDVEGACWDATTQRLLLACKADPGSDLDKHEQRAIYAFDPISGVLDPAPVYVVELDDVRDALKARNQGIRQLQFAPSALEIHPYTGDLWVLSAHDRLVVVISRNGQVLDATLLAPELYVQPEGLTFDPNGRLFISSEGGDHKGYLLSFTPRKHIR